MLDQKRRTCEEPGESPGSSHSLMALAV